VIPPWALALKGENLEIYATSVMCEIAESQLAYVDLKQVVKKIDESSFSRNLLRAIYKTRHGPKIIITSSPESRMSIKLLLRILFIALVGCEVLCIRNSNSWTKDRVKPFQVFKNSLPTNIQIKARIPPPMLRVFPMGLVIHIVKFILLIRSLIVFPMELVSYIVESVLLIRSKKLVFETEDQLHYFQTNSKLKLKQKNLIFSGRLPISAYHQTKRDFQEVIGKSTNIGIGVVGTININKRKYEPLKEAIDILLKQNYKVNLFFLGSFIGPSSQDIIEMFSNVIAFCPTARESFVSENTTWSLIDDIDVLISPLSDTWGYHNGKSTGAIADAIFYSKPLLMPSYLEKTFGTSNVNYYENGSDLATKLSDRIFLKFPTVGEITTANLQAYIKSADSLGQSS